MNNSSKKTKVKHLLGWLALAGQVSRAEVEIVNYSGAKQYMPWEENKTEIDSSFEVFVTEPAVGLTTSPPTISEFYNYSVLIDYDLCIYATEFGMRLTAA